MPTFLTIELRKQQFSATTGNMLLGDSGQPIARQPMAARWPSLATVGNTYGVAHILPTPELRHALRLGNRRQPTPMWVSGHLAVLGILGLWVLLLMKPGK